MRFKKRDFRRFVKGHLGFDFGAEKLTSHAGLELLRRFAESAGLLGKLRDLDRRLCWRGDVRFSSMVLLFVGMLAVGGRRLRHIRYLEGDPMLSRFASLRRVPGERTLSRFLKKFRHDSWPVLDELGFQIATETLKPLKLRRLTLDIDGSVVQTGLKVQRARRGFNPHHRKNPSYYPITVQVAQTSQILAHKNRPGNVHDSRGAARFLEDSIGKIRGAMEFSGILEARMDSAFFQREILDLSDRRQLEYAIKVPMMPWLNLRSRIAKIRPKQWKRVQGEPDIQGAFLDLSVQQWDRKLRVAVFRKRVFHRTRKNYQLDLFHPDDGTWEYSAVATNKSLKLRALWEFANGRGAHEKTYSELRSGYAYGYTPTNSYAGNTAWQKLNILTHNFLVAYQVQLGAASRRRSLKRTALVVLQSIQSHRFTWLNKAARLVNRSGRNVLRLEWNPATEELFAGMARKLRSVA